MSLIDACFSYLTQPVENVGIHFNARVCHVVAIEQAPGDSACGYYALHNLRQLMTAREAMLLEAAAAPTEEEAVAVDPSSCQDCIRALLDRSAFESTKAAVVSALQSASSNEKNNDSYPWRDEDITCEVLERAHLDHLLNSSAGTAVDFVSRITPLMDFNRASLATNRFPTRAAAALDVAIRRVKEGVLEDAFAALLVGVGIHYISIFVHRRPDGCVEILLLDSQNKQVIGMDKQFLLRSASAMPYKSWVESGWPIATMVNLQVDSLEGTQTTIELIRQCVLDEDSICSGLLHINFDGFLSSYHDYLDVTEEEEVRDMDASQWLKACKGWCENRFPPAQIESNIVGTLREIKAPSNAIVMSKEDLANVEAQLLSWLGSVRLKLAESDTAHVEEEDQPGMRDFIQRFSRTLRQLEAVLPAKASL